ncbi:MAG: porin [Rhizobiaceae bacterium]|nr:porin [Hyphomicrobiales bacterium]NRB31937.1 porin [Rhizobiaceae bacterium]
MKLKSLLMGSAAALITSNMAYAADAPTAEPEPTDHVRVCDMYGSGFYYMPGTETCLGISGEVRFQYEGTTTDINDVSESSGSPYWYARVNVDVREETDLGMLRAYIRLEGDSTHENRAENFGPLDTYIEIGGLSMGYRTSRVELTGLPGLMYDGSYFGGGRTWYVDYTFAVEELTLMGGASIENADVDDYNDAKANGGSADFYIRADYSMDMFAFGASYGHDSSAEEGALGAYITATPVDGLTVQRYYNMQNESTQFGGDTGETQKYGIGASFQVADAILIAGGWYQVDTEKDGTDLDGYSLGLDWNATSNLVVRLGFNYEDSDDVGEVTDYRIRVQRNF